MEQVGLTGPLGGTTLFWTSWLVALIAQHPLSSMLSSIRSSTLWRQCESSRAVLHLRCPCTCPTMQHALSGFQIEGVPNE